MKKCEQTWKTGLAYVKCIPLQVRVCGNLPGTLYECFLKVNMLNFFLQAND